MPEVNFTDPSTGPPPLLPLDVQRRVRSAVSAEWPTFARDHPELAEVVDEDLLVRQATESLADDPTFIRAMRDADAAGTIYETAAELVRKAVGRWLKRLI